MQQWNDVIVTIIEVNESTLNFRSSSSASGIGMPWSDTAYDRDLISVRSESRILCSSQTILEISNSPRFDCDRYNVSSVGTATRYERVIFYESRSIAARYRCSRYITYSVNLQGSPASEHKSLLRKFLSASERIDAEVLGSRAWNASASNKTEIFRDSRSLGISNFNGIIQCNQYCIVIGRNEANGSTGIRSEFYGTAASTGLPTKGTKCAARRKLPKIENGAFLSSFVCTLHRCLTTLSQLSLQRLGTWLWSIDFHFDSAQSITTCSTVLACVALYSNCRKETIYF